MRVPVILALALLATACAAAPPGANDLETHRGATVIAPGSSPGLNGPYGRDAQAPGPADRVPGPAHFQESSRFQGVTSLGYVP